MNITPTEVKLFDFPVHLVDLIDAQAQVEQAILEHKNFHVVTLNPEMLMAGEKDRELGRILKKADLVLPDGAGVVWALRRKSCAVKRLPGIEFAENLLRWASGIGYRVAIVGASQEALDLAVDTLTKRYDGLKIVYSHHGFFRSANEEQTVAEACAASHPHLLLVALGVPRQEKWIDRYRSLFHGTTLVGIGGSLDVWSGKTQRAPRLMRALNLEWLYRIATEPWRIRRTYKSLPLFVVKVLLSGDKS